MSKRHTCQQEEGCSDEGTAQLVVVVVVVGSTLFPVTKTRQDIFLYNDYIYLNTQKTTNVSEKDANKLSSMSMFLPSVAGFFIFNKKLQTL